MILWGDYETWCEADLSEVGTYQYAEQAQALLFAYAIDDEAAKVWDCTAEPDCPEDLHYALTHADEVWFHNAQFDKAIHNGPAQLRLPRIALERWRCSMAQALSHALPGGLADLCRVLKVPADQAKLADGKKLVRLFTQPQPKGRKIQRATRETHPAEWERFKQYAVNDITAMRECVRRMPTWNWDASAIAEWHLDQRINERGFAVDQELTQAGARAAVEEKARIDVRFAELSKGEFRPTQRAKFLDYLNARLGFLGIDLDNTQSGTLKLLLRDPEIPADVAEMMELAIAANKTSTAKYAALDPAVSPDGRFRGGLQFAGASRTRRWAGRLFQPQNLPSRGLPPAAAIEEYIWHLKNGSHTLFFDNLMLYGAAALRGVVVAPPGKKMVVADLSNIEGRVLAWIAQEHWKLKAFREYDAGTGPDLYNITAVSIIGGDPWKVEKGNRNAFGKVPDLASGYQGGVAGYQQFARAYGVKMSDYWDTIKKLAYVEQAWENLNSWGRPQLESLEISEIEWVASETCKLAWRARHPATKRFWYDLGGAMKDAIRNPGQVFCVGPYIKLRTVIYRGFRWLVVRLPSGRFLTYFEPHLTDDGTIAYWGEAAEEGRTTRQWVKVFTHGGKATGNCCQTIARDILTPSLAVAEKRGYLPILSVHDEALTEVPDNDEFTAGELVEILSAGYDWTEGLPLAAAGFEAYRYKKD